MLKNHGDSTSSAFESQSSRSTWTQIVLGESEPIMEKEKSDNFGLVQCNAEKKPVWNKPSNGSDSEIRPVIGTSSWPALSETTKAPPSNKSSSNSLKSLGDGSSSSVPLSQRNEFASQSHGRTQNQYQQNSYKNHNGNHHPHQSHGGRRSQEHGNQNWNHRINFDGRGGFAQPPRGTPVFARHAPPPHMRPIHAQYIHQPFYPFIGPKVFPELAPRLMHHLHGMPFIEPPPFIDQFQDSSLETRIRNQVHYYFSEDNLCKDEFLRKRMNDEGFVHIQFIASFKKLKALTYNIQFILNALQGSEIVELKGYEIRNRYKWRRFLMPFDLRVPFYPNL